MTQALVTQDRELVVLEDALFHLMRASRVQVANADEARELLFRWLRDQGVRVDDTREARLLLVEGALLHGLRNAGSKVASRHELRLELGLGS